MKFYEFVGLSKDQNQIILDRLSNSDITEVGIIIDFCEILCTDD